MPDEETNGIFARERRDTGVASHVRIERLLLRPECVEQVKGHLPVVILVIPLQEHMQRDRDLTRLLHDRLWHVAAREKSGRRDARISCSHAGTDRDQAAIDSNPITNLGQSKHLIKGCLPLRHRLINKWKD